MKEKVRGLDVPKVAGSERVIGILVVGVGGGGFGPLLGSPL